MVLVYSDNKTSRVDYVTGLIFRELLGVDVGVTTSASAYEEYQDEKVWYSAKPCPAGVHIVPCGLLLAKGIGDVDARALQYNDISCLFPVTGGALPYDPFSATFFLVTRYEEYLPFRADEHGRFQSKESVAAKNNFLHTPVVNHYALHLKEKIVALFPAFNPPGTQYKFTLTVDIDSAWAIRNKGFIRTIGGVLGDIKNRDLDALKYRIKVLRGKENDPFDSFNHLFTYQRKRPIDMVFFILLGDYSKYDKNISHNNIRFQDLIKRIADYAAVGIHPSYESRNNPERVLEEISRLKSIIRRSVFRSRQHFLRLDMPATYRTLAGLGIREDYTMGYADDYGFRAGICSPYYFYDLEIEQITGLRIFPFAFMDGTLRDYLQKTPAEAKAIIDTLVEEVRAVNGHFISLWHNESLGERGRWVGWKDVCDHLIEKGNQK